MPNNKPLAWRALCDFLSYSPFYIILLNIGTLLQGASAVVSLFVVIPLAQLSGVNLLAAQSTSPWGFLSVIANWISQFQFTKDLHSILIFYVIIASFMAAIGYAQQILGATIQEGYTKTKRLKIYNALLSAKWEYISSSASSEFLHRLGNQVQSMNSAAHSMILLAHKIILTIILICIMAALNWQFTMMTLVCALIVGLVTLPVRLSVRDAGKKRLRGFHQIFRLLSEHLSSLKMIKSSGRELDFQDKLQTVSDELENQQIRLTRAAATISFANRVALAGGFSIMLFIAVNWLKVPIANFLLLLLIMSRLMPQLASIQLSLQHISYSLPAYKDIEKTLAQTSSMREATLKRNLTPLPLQDKIDLCDVYFKHPNNIKDTISKLNFTLPAKKTLALVGPSGAGKTTLADIFVGLLHPDKGRFLIDGKPLEHDLINRWRHSVAYVTQQNYFFHDTIKNNLIWINPKASDADIWHALDLAALKDHVSNLSNGLESIIGENGIKLSGGERQRLAIARALLSNPQLLILDEATSALDASNEKLIHQTLLNLHNQFTTIIIAHNPKTLKHADIVLYLGGHEPKTISRNEYEQGITFG